MTTDIIFPVIVLVIWSLVMWLWMYVTRVPAIQSMKLQLDSDAPRGEQMATLPARVRWKADNYNHLMEEPTLFYALSIGLAVIGQGDGTNLMLAWVYVGLRVVHSLVQALVNKIEVRFLIFVLSNIPLMWMAFNGVSYFLSGTN